VLRGQLLHAGAPPWPAQRKPRRDRTREAAVDLEQRRCGSHRSAPVLRTNRYGRAFNGVAHAAVSRRPPISLYTSVARTHMHTCAANVWDFSIVQGPFLCRPAPV
jgi:hypothetical protein